MVFSSWTSVVMVHRVCPDTCFHRCHRSIKKKSLQPAFFNKKSSTNLDLKPHYLVVSTHLKNISQNENLPQIVVKIKKNETTNQHKKLTSLGFPRYIFNHDPPRWHPRGTSQPFPSPPQNRRLPFFPREGDRSTSGVRATKPQQFFFWSRKSGCFRKSGGKLPPNHRC